MGYGIALMEKHIDYGLIKENIINLYDLLNYYAQDEIEVFPIEILAKDHECSAMGFITIESADLLDYDYEKSGLNDFIANILDDMDNEREDCTYEFKGIKIWLSR